MNSLIERIVIVGGGTAGWLVAGILAAHCRANQSSVQITLVESPDVQTIGVGEGTWPSMRGTLQKLGVPESEFVTQCAVSFKQGSKFIGWRDGTANDVYYHPFMLPQGDVLENLIPAWQMQRSQLSFADAVCMQPRLCETLRAPKQKTTPEYAGVTNYGYHLDAGKFGQLLQRHCTEQLGVSHLIDHVVAVKPAANGDIAALQTKMTGDVPADLFVDCSGLVALLLGQHFNVPFIDQSHILFNDSALAMQVPYLDGQDVIASPTIATAQSSGWIWDIGLSTRRGVGYVYSSAHTTDESAEAELRRYVAGSVGEGVAQSGGVRKLSIRAGYRKEFWHKNCVAVGMSAGFIEPLEASALALVELSANFISSELPISREVMHTVAKRFNQRFEYRWQRVIDFLKLHYVLTKRTDTDYWRDAAHPDTTPENLRELLSLWRYRPPCYNDFIQNEEVFPSASYHYVLYGMGFEPNVFPGASAERLEAGNRLIGEILAKSRRYAEALPTNRELIEHIRKNGMHRV